MSATPQHDVPTESAGCGRSHSAWLSRLLAAMPRGDLPGTPPGIPGACWPRRPERDHRILHVGARAGRDPVRRADRRHPVGLQRLPGRLHQHGQQLLRAHDEPPGRARQYWRVQAFNATGEPCRLGGPRRSPRRRSQVRCWSRRADGRTRCTQPSNPPLLHLEPVAGRDHATWWRSTATATSSAPRRTRRTSTSLVVPDPLGAGDWFWRVIAGEGQQPQVGLPSAAATSFVISADHGARDHVPARRHRLRAHRTSSWTGTRCPARCPTRSRSRPTPTSAEGSLIELRTRDPRAPGTPRRSPTTTTSTTGGCAPSTRPTSRRRGPRRATDFTRTWPRPKPTPVYPAAAGTEHVPAPALLPVDAGAARLGVRVPGRHPGELHRRHLRVSAAWRARRTRPDMFAINTTRPSRPPFRDNEDC